MNTLSGKTLLIGPSRAGKSYFAAALRAMGLDVVDLDAETELVAWRDDATLQRVEKPKHVTREWLVIHHFLIDPGELRTFLNGQGDVLVFAHCWNIMDVLDQFDRLAYMVLPDEELERRFLIDRPDHNSTRSEDELAFFRERHRERRQQAAERGIAFVDATLQPAAFYEQISKIPA